MNSFTRASTLLLLTLIWYLSAQCQEKDYFGEYRPAVQKAAEYLRMMEKQDASALKQAFSATSFQEQKDFLNYMSSENLTWTSELLKKYGIPGDDQTAISVWRVKDKKVEESQVSVNISFYFKEPSESMSLLSDRICINMSMRGGVYVLDGVLLFRKSEYEAFEKVIQNIPE